MSNLVKLKKKKKILFSGIVCCAVCGENSESFTPGKSTDEPENGMTDVVHSSGKLKFNLRRSEISFPQSEAEYYQNKVQTENHSVF